MAVTGYWVLARELMVGEMVTIDFDDYMLHHYYEVVGHDHPTNVILKSTSSGRETRVPYDQKVRKRPDAYKHCNKGALESIKCYKRWPYDEEGNFCWVGRDVSGWGSL